MGIKLEYNHQSRTNKLRRCAASSSAAEFLIVFNQTQGELHFDLELSEYMELLPSPHGHGLTYPKLSYNGIDVSFLAGFRHGSYSLPQGSEDLLYLYHGYTSGEEEFSELEPYEQIKILYKKFTVVDDTGTEILTLDTLRPEQFVREENSNHTWCLVIE